MDGLNVEEMRRNAQGPPNILHQKLSLNDNLNNMKTPRRGLGMIVNQTKTPCSQIRQFTAQGSSVKHDNRTNFEVFEDESEDAEEPELKKLEFDVEEDFASVRLETEKVIEEDEKSGGTSSPIEGVSRLSYGHDSLQSLHEQKLTDLDDVVLVDDGPSIDNFSSFDVTEKAALAQLGVEEWDEYPPIEKASRIDNHNFYFEIEDLSHQYVDLVNDQDYAGLNSSETEAPEDVVRISYDEFGKWLDEQEEEEEKNNSFGGLVDV